MNEKVILLARQRSGTHALKSILQSHPDFHCFEEIFHADPAFRSYPENFFRFVEERQFPAAALFPWNIESTLERFWEHLDELADAARFQVLDVKYNSTHFVTPAWQPLNYYPRLFDYIKENKLRVIHLIRRNSLRQWVSGKIAARLRTWSIRHETPEPPQSVRIEIQPLIWALQGMAEEDAVLFRGFWNYDVLELEYADLFLRPDGCVPPSALKRISDWFGVANRFASLPECSKQLSFPLTMLIENYDEVATALRETPFSWMLNDEPLIGPKG
jgi:hypothetical protein